MKSNKLYLVSFYEDGCSVDIREVSSREEALSILKEDEAYGNYSQSGLISTDYTFPTLSFNDHDFEGSDELLYDAKRDFKNWSLESEKRD